MLSPTTRGELAKLRAAHDNPKADQVEIGLGKAYVTAAREGIEFRLNSPTEQALIRQTIEAAPREPAKGAVFR